MSMNTNWIAYELRRLAPRRFKRGGIDLNGNGKLERNEKISTYNNNYVPGNNRKVVGDGADWLAFYQKNVRGIHRMFKKLGYRYSQMGLFKYARRFRTTSPLHLVLINESPLATWSDISSAYVKTSKVLSTLRWAVRRRRATRLTREQRLALQGLSWKKRAAHGRAMRQLNAINYTMRRWRFIGKNRPKSREPLYFNDIKSGQLGYAAMTYLAVTLAHEMGSWPIYAVRVPHNIFVRWDKRGVKINMDRGKSHSDSYYIDKHSLHEALKRRPKPYLRTLKGKGLVAIVKRMVGEAFYQEQQYKQAERHLTAALKLDKAFVRAYNFRGMSRYLQGKHRGAIADFKEAIRRNPKYGSAYYTLGITYRLLGKPLKAIKAFDKAMSLFPPKKRIYIFYRRSKAHYSAGNFAKAKSDAEALIRLQPTFKFAHRQLGIVLFAQKNYPLAIKHLKKSLKQDGKNAETLFMLGRSHYILGKFSAARAFYRQAAKADSKDRSIRRHLGMANLRLGNYKAAVADFQKTLRANMSDKEDVDALYHSSLARKALARKLKLSGQRQKAREQMRLAKSEYTRFRIHGLRIAKSSSNNYPHIEMMRRKATKVPMSEPLKKFRLYRSAYRAYKAVLKTNPDNTAWIRLQMAELLDLMRAIREYKF